MAIIRLSHEQFEDGFEWPLFFLAALQAALVGQLAQFKLEPSLITLSSQTTFDDAEVWLSIRDFRRAPSLISSWLVAGTSP
jgi:hypothetical protein